MTTTTRTSLGRAVSDSEARTGPNPTDDPAGRSKGAPEPLSASLGRLRDRLGIRAVDARPLTAEEAAAERLRQAEEAAEWVQQQQQDARTRRWEASVPERCRAARVHTLMQVAETPEEKASLEQVLWVLRLWIDGQKPNLGLSGNVGVGKTWAMVAAGYLAVERGSDVLYVSGDDLCDAHFRENGNRALVGSCRVTPVLALDDIGAEYASDFSVSVLGSLLDYRWRNNLRTMFTTNVKDGETAAATLEARYDTRLVSRLVGDAVTARMTGPDRRRQAF